MRGKACFGLSVLLAVAAASSARAQVVSFDFTGADPGLNLPWTAASQIADHVRILRGVQRALQPGTTFNPQGGSDELRFQVSAPGGTDSDLDFALTNDTYFWMVLQAEAGYALDLRSAAVSADLIHLDGHGPRSLAVFTSLDGFAPGSEVATGGPTPKWSTPATATATGSFGGTDDYAKVTLPVELRYYPYGSQWGHKPGALDNFSVGGSVVELGPDDHLPQTLVAFDFAGTDPGQNLPWTAPSELADHVKLVRGVERAVHPGTLFNPAAGDDQLGFTINGPGTESDLQWALDNDTYYSTIIQPETGYAMDLRGAPLWADVLHTDGNGPRSVAVFSSLEGFVAGAELAAGDPAAKSAPSTGIATGTFPDTETYANVTVPVELRYYVYGNQFAGKPGALDNLFVVGTLVEVGEDDLLPRTLVSFDFAGMSPGQNLPWTDTVEQADHVALVSGFSLAPSPGVAFTGQPGDDRVQFQISGPGGTDSDLRWALDNDAYFSVVLEPEDGYALDLRGGAVMADVLHLDGHGPRSVAVLTDIEGFDDEALALMMAGPTPKWSTPTTATLLGYFPDTAPYALITDPVELRFYLYGNQHGFKPGAMDNVSIFGTLVPLDAEPIPEPATAVGALVGLGALLLVARHGLRGGRNR